MVAQSVIRTGLRCYCLSFIFGKMAAPIAIENVPMGVAEDPAVTTPPAKRRGGVVSLSMGAMPRTGATPTSPAERYDVASPRQGRAASVGGRKRRGETVDTLRTLSAAPASSSPGPMLPPGPDA